MMRGEKGTVLLVTLWILAILSLLALGIGFRTSIDLRLVSYQIDSLKAYEIAKAGIVRVINELERDGYISIDTPWACGITLNEDETFDRKFRNIRVGEGYFYIYYIEDLQGMININTADINSTEPRILRALSSEITPEIALNIRVWRGEVPPTPGTYSDMPYTSKGAAFDIIEELLLVKDITKEIFYGKDGEGSGIKDLITVYPKEPKEGFKVNVNTASQEVLEALFEAAAFDRTAAGKIVNDRSGVDGDIMKKDDNIFCPSDDVQTIQAFIIREAGPSYQGTPQETEALARLSSWLTVKSNYFKIYSQGTLEGRKSSIHRGITCVVKRDVSTGPPYKAEIISWAEE